MAEVQFKRGGMNRARGGNATGRINLGRLVLGGLVAGSVINGIELLVHRVILNMEWMVPFAALGKVPTGWTVFIPSNFLVGIVAAWVYARIRSTYRAGLKAAILAGLATWVVFWIIPIMALMPLKLFPNQLLFAVIGVGLADAVLTALLGAWLYMEAYRLGMRENGSIKAHLYPPVARCWPSAGRAENFLLLDDRRCLLRDRDPAALLFYIDPGKPILPASISAALSGLLHNFTSDDGSVSVLAHIEIREFPRLKLNSARFKSVKDLRLLQQSALSVNERVVV
ncbi:MAG TPA: hypothetical protein VJK29_05550 [Terriglobales bacterium]|nr:hypothetical protein [Terriglobales bacterium]